MTLQNNLQQGRNFTREENEKFIKLLNEGMYQEAKNFADNLVIQGVSVPLINYSGNEVFQRLTNKNFEEAKKLTETFSDYYWPCWLRDSSF
jgi:hypothetical protein